MGLGLHHKPPPMTKKCWKEEKGSAHQEVHKQEVGRESEKMQGLGKEPPWLPCGLGYQKQKT